MCATLAWQQQQCGGKATGQVPPGPDTPRIFWAARTHAQIDHAVREVRSAFGCCYVVYQLCGKQPVSDQDEFWLQCCLLSVKSTCISASQETATTLMGSVPS